METQLHKEESHKAEEQCKFRNQSLLVLITVEFYVFD